ncbi:hypothetical protein C8J57DRAFT_1268861 [Mycena rebaudengoi]|nr:hypothetical protein C8J57DRAFT_1268861 [Mycena rebaudengoi]
MSTNTSAPTPRASLLSGLRTGGVRSTSNIPHTAAPGGTFNIPRITSNLPTPVFPEEDNDHGGQFAQHAFANHGVNRTMPMTAAVDGHNNRFMQQQDVNSNIGSFSSAFGNQPNHVQAQALQMQISASSSSTTIFSKADSTPSSRPPSARAPPTATFASSSKYDPPPFTAPPTSTPSAFPRFGTNNSCPGCHKSVSPMERGVVPGPQGSCWHATCLVCGGKKEIAKGWNARAGDQKKKGVPGCGKKLDSAAEGDGEGGIWCRKCSLLLPVRMRASPQGSPTRPMAPTYTGNGAFTKVAPQYTGTTTIARQFTGYGGDPGIFSRRGLESNSKHQPHERDDDQQPENKTKERRRDQEY